MKAAARWVALALAAAAILAAWVGTVPEGGPAGASMGPRTVELRSLATPPGPWNWTNMSPPSAPSARADVVMVYDSHADRIILFGGYLGGFTGAADTWAYDDDANTWTNLTPASHPSGRWGHAMAYDRRADRVILFGGFDGSNVLNDTWAYDFGNDTWTEMNPAGNPPLAGMHALAYDEAADRVILFGGIAAGGDSNATWAYDYANNTWARRTPILSPSGRRSMGITYDSDAGRIVIFGGWDSNDTFLNETWMYSASADTWSNLTTSIAPPNRYWPSIAYDSAVHRTILFGGWGGSEIFNDTWALSLGFRAWGQLSPVASPPPRRNFQMAYDSQSDRVVVFGGLGNYDFPRNDTWASGGPPPAPRPPSAPQDLKAFPGNGSVNLTWSPPATDGGSPVTAYRIYRANDSGNLSILAEVGDTRAYTDAGATNGVTYRYDVTAVNLAGEGPPSANATSTPDGTPPQTSLFLSGTLGSNGWYRSDVNVTLSALDDNSGVASTMYRLDLGTWDTYGSPFAVAGDGNHSVDYYSVDVAGNVEPFHTAFVPIDTTGPTTTLAAAGTTGDNGWYVSTVTIRLTSNDSGSGTASVLYRLDANGSWQGYAGPFNLTDGMWTVQYCSVDSAGNTGPVDSSAFRIDRVAPITQVAVDGAPGAEGWYRGDVTVTLTSSDAGSGVASLLVSMDGGPWTTYGAPLSLTDQGLHVVRYSATDVAGNVEPVRDLIVRIDSVAPATAVTVDGAMGASGWMRSATVALAPKDSSSGVRATYFRLDGGIWQAYGASFGMPNGEHAMDYYSVDVAGNAEAIQSLALKIDGDPPTITLPPMPSTFTTADVHLEWSAHDNTSGLGGYRISVDGAPFEDVGLATHADLTLGDGAHTVLVRAFDVAGNDATLTIPFRVDTSGIRLSGLAGGAAALLIVGGATGAAAGWMWRRRRRRGQR